MSLQLTLGFYLIISSNNGEKLRAEFEQSIETHWNDTVSMFLTVDTTTNIVDIIMTGPYGQWFGIGFGSSMMNNTYAIVVSDFDIIEEFIVTEYKLSKGEAGSICTAGGCDLTPFCCKTYLIEVYEGYVVDGGRTVTLQRNRTGETDDHYTFPDTATNIDIIWAFGHQSGNTYAYHGTAEEKARGSSTIYLGPTMRPTPNPTTEEFQYFDSVEKECNFFNRDYNGPMATDTCFKSVDYGSTMMDSTIYECDAETNSNSVIAKAFWCNGENCVGTVDNCAEKGLLDAAIYSTLDGYDANYAKWNCLGRNDCDKLTVKYECCFQNSCYGGDTADKYETTYMQNMCWSQHETGIVLHCENDQLIIDQYNYANCTELVSSEPYDKELHFDVTGWESTWCDKFSYVCSSVKGKCATIAFWCLFLCLIH